ncbi:uncharacterized protein LOC129597428 [Paramacrobiotus metropolitanus]|uniref:uncharacterized protein LOC129597428 n=1 Tax=Paramacrobiotus metropolitanus TaxID=2943436 RepID=UPI002445F9DF|nr:uncharacterized protein LOC129597428 [Paramacrobiotus metropolitanus]XP_055350941.1 uncharacterized protein LOC129597428 [Paramacrobiotus metropolitanus]
MDEGGGMLVAGWITLIIVLAIFIFIPLIILAIVCYRRKYHGTVQGAVTSGAPTYPVGQPATVTYPTYGYAAYSYPATGAAPPPAASSAQPPPADPAAAATPAPPPTRKTH